MFPNFYSIHLKSSKPLAEWALSVANPKGFRNLSTHVITHRGCCDAFFGSFQ